MLFSSDSEALKIANSTKFALTAAIWTSDTGRATCFANRVSAGLVNINGPTHGAEPNMPFGGYGASGNGTKEAGIDSLIYYSGQKVIATFNTIIE
jgi:aldehyde dehydrogenase (NAD+)